MHNLTIREAVESDLDLLAEMNKQLIEDEQHDNSMDSGQLKERMQRFIETDYTAYLFLCKGEATGYSLIRHHSVPLYIRHFFIRREYRRQGLGREAFRVLTSHLHTDNLDVEAMFWNEQALGFWRSLGFKEKSVYFRSGPNP
ncbi:GNAT family N-acetyltransferase [Paenibacillus sp. HN-1]|uniref:GNAT family N-acetyltransferase n=1 Tax=Paenibacillus TaxID=44249 RepID=UPI001CA8ED73|nr:MULTISPECIES: GNAT family N-acetyltransferase [Paenibacillus]MBY9078392.1 GNAT family N-acetyltransferase [Paenibacillus sp. CGMCC 1.18879]MBY9087893.1 GNAT family N-acetyltransferase [Paenibacillus sinensis]